MWGKNVSTKQKRAYIVLGTPLKMFYNNLQSLINISNVTFQKQMISVQHTINFVGTVDHRVCSMSVPDQVHSILFTVEGPLGSAIKQT